MYFKKFDNFHLIHLFVEKLDVFNHCMKYARIRVFSDLYSPVYRHNLRFCPYLGEYGSLKTRILAYFMQ